MGFDPGFLSSTETVYSSSNRGKSVLTYIPLLIDLDCDFWVLTVGFPNVQKASVRGHKRAQQGERGRIQQQQPT